MSEEEDAKNLEAVLDVHEERGKCIEQGCPEPRCVEPGVGLTVLCEFHLRLVRTGLMRPPPLRRTIDYVTPSRVPLILDILGATPPRTSAEDAKEMEESVKGILDALHRWSSKLKG
jgi:hypothetical protein